MASWLRRGRACWNSGTVVSVAATLVLCGLILGSLEPTVDEKGPPRKFPSQNWVWKPKHKVSKIRLSVATSSIFNSTEIHTDEEDDRTCSRRRKIGFLKTHKTASSTVQNILLRYGYINHMNFLLPKVYNVLNDPKHYYRLEEPFREDFLRQVPWHKDFKAGKLYDIAALHTKWNHKVFRSLLGPEAVFMTILRSPSDSFQSLYTYSKLTDKFNMTSKEFIERSFSDRLLAQSRAEGHLGFNMDLWDLGMSQDELNSPEKVERKIEQVDRDFSLVMITERIEESLVLLADLLCVPLWAVASFKLNARRSDVGSSNEDSIKLSESQLEKLRMLQAPDEKLYAHFLQRLEAQISSFGRDRMSRAVSELRRLNAQLRENCAARVASQAEARTLSARYKVPDNVEALKVRSDLPECVLAAMPELDFVDLVRSAQKKRWKNWMQAKVDKLHFQNDP